MKKRSLETMAGFGRTFLATEPEKRSWGNGGEPEDGGREGGAEAGELITHRTGWRTWDLGKVKAWHF